MSAQQRNLCFSFVMLPSEVDLWAAGNGSRSGGGGDGGGGDASNTLTFLVGFGVLVLFVLGGVLASVFLCVTLKKDPYLWDAGPEPDHCLAPPAELTGPASDAAGADVQADVQADADASC